MSKKYYTLEMSIEEQEFDNAGNIVGYTDYGKSGTYQIPGKPLRLVLFTKRRVAKANCDRVANRTWEWRLDSNDDGLSRLTTQRTKHHGEHPRRKTERQALPVRSALPRAAALLCGSIGRGRHSVSRTG